MMEAHEPMIDDIRPIKGIDTSRGTLDVSTGTTPILVQAANIVFAKK